MKKSLLFLICISAIINTLSFAQSSSLDSTFSGDGIQTTAIGTSDDYGNSVAIQSDGKIVVAGSSKNGTNYDFALTRYNSDGTLDSTFSGDGIQTTAIGAGDDYGPSVALQSDGKIVVAGTSKMEQILNLQ